MVADLQKWNDVFEAAEHKDLEAIQLFVKYEKEVLRMTNDKGESIAMIAVRKYDFPTMKYVLEMDNSTLLLNYESGHNMIEVAMKNNATYTVKYLVEHHNWDVHHQNRAHFGNTPIHYAAEIGQLEILKYFIEECGGDVNFRNDNGDPPVFLAAEAPHMDIITYLVESRQANLKAVNSRNENILFAAVKEDNPRVFYYVLFERRVPLNINWVNNRHQTILHVAIRKRKPQIIGFLLGRTAIDVNKGDNQKRTALHMAAFENNYPLFKLLVEHGADIRVKDNYGYQPVDNAHDPQIKQYFQSVIAALQSSTLSVTPSLNSTPTLSSTSLNTYELSSTSSSTIGIDITSGGLTTFLGVVSTVVSYMNSSTSNNFQSTSPSPASLSEKIDPIAVEAVNTAPK